jgi:DNA helicase HerA-like ATPase
VVLEEAHNYIPPRKQDEPRGLAVSRETFERIAKEGRKFGISLIVASQRPSDISATVLSQCANFIMHRLQNPDDIEHFRRIVPSQSRRLLDQITILGAGEGIALGSAFHVPARVHIDRPEHVPSSQSSAPHLGWQTDGQTQFDMETALKNWGVEISTADKPVKMTKPKKKK